VARPVDDPLGLPAVVVVRGLVLRHLDKAAAAAVRLGDAADAEALHDFRVALRRLRATEKAYRTELADVFTGKLRKRLSRLARATGPARDTEVQLAWVDAQAPAMRAHQRPGWHFVRRRLLARLAEEYAEVRGDAVREFAAFEVRLRDGLDAAPGETSVGAGSRVFAQAAADALGPLLAEMSARVASLDPEADDEAVHELRLIAKRARYLLDPCAAAMPPAGHLAEELADWQDRLGRIHDLQVFGDELIAAARAAGASVFAHLIEHALHGADEESLRTASRRRDERAGLIALARCAAEQRHAELDEVWKKIGRGEADRLLEKFAETVTALAAIAPQDVEGGGASPQYPGD
jgi:CHAD domain-containing protein